MGHQLFLWALFGVIIIGMAALDLGVFNRRAHAVTLREALIWSAIWIGLALSFNYVIYLSYGSEKALLFLTGYLIEEALSVDNLFIFMVIFSYFSVPKQHQHKILFWGILGAMLMRGVFIGAGVSLIHRFHWLIYVFGVFLLYTGFRLIQEKSQEVHPEKNVVLKWFRRLMPVSTEYAGDKFFIQRDGKRWATPMLVVLLVIETTDVLFAMDSIPAIFAITTDPLLVYTSNIFAILGMRSLFFALQGFMQMFRYLNYGLSAILVFIGLKMISSEFYAMPIFLALGVVAAILAISMLASVLIKPVPDKTN